MTLSETLRLSPPTPPPFVDEDKSPSPQETGDILGDDVG